MAVRTFLANSITLTPGTVLDGEAAYDTAVISRKEYLEGTYEQERKTIENELFLAEETLKKAQKIVLDFIGQN